MDDYDQEMIERGVAQEIERRAKDSDDLADLLHEILVAQVATYLGVEPSVIDPSLEDED